MEQSTSNGAWGAAQLTLVLGAARAGWVWPYTPEDVGITIKDPRHATILHLLNLVNEAHQLGASYRVVSACGEAKGSGIPQGLALCRAVQMARAERDDRAQLSALEWEQAWLLVCHVGLELALLTARAAQQ